MTMAVSGVENQKGEVNIQTRSSANPAYVPGHPFTGESSTKDFLYSVGGYLVAFIISTALIVLAIHLP